MAEPKRHSILGALIGLTFAENGGDVMDEVFIICDALGIERPEYDDEFDRFVFSFEEEEE